VTDQGDKPVFNERVLAKLLEAAYVVQEHNRATQAAPVPGVEVRQSEVRPVEVEHAAVEAKAKTELAQSAEAPASSETPAPELERVRSEPAPDSFAAASSDTIFSEPVLSASVLSAPVSSTPVSSAPTLAAAVSAVPLPHASLSGVPVSEIPASVVPASAAQAAAPATDDYATTLAQIVDTQRQIRERLLELKDPMALIAERVSQIARASGAAIGIVEGATLRYRASAGLMTPSVAEVAREKALCAICLQSGQVMRRPDTDASAVDGEEMRLRGIRAMIAVPIFHESAVAGGLELYYAAANAFLEQDVHTAQLMAGLVTEALAREEEITRRKSLAGERALMLEALERLQPNLAALVETSVAKTSPAKTSPAKAAPAHAAPPEAATPKTAVACRKCGHDLLDDEQFCGKCGTPRSGDYEPPSMQSKVASMLHMQEALKKIPGVTGNGAMGNIAAGNGVAGNGAAGNGSGSLTEPAPGFDDAEFQKMLTDSLEKEMPELFQPLETRTGKMWPETLETPADRLLKGAEAVPEPAAGAEEDVEEKPSESEEEALAATALAKPARSLDWSSAASAREFLEQLAGQRSNGLARFWRARRGDFYLALAVVLVAIVIRWGIWSNHPVSATGTPATAAAQHRKAAPDADLSWFDRTMVKLGLAEAPAPAEYKGNPDIEVWIDLRTALYYCPGTDLYGKSPKGKFETQRDAQLDQFEPANRKSCD
jgi:hypothetical protein